LNTGTAVDSSLALFRNGCLRRSEPPGTRSLSCSAPLAPLDGLVRYEVPLLDTSYNRDLAPGLRAGAYGSSFRFNVLADDFNPKAARSAHNPQGLPERTVRELTMAEFGPVTFPAYAGATAGMRSLTDASPPTRICNRARWRNSCSPSACNVGTRPAVACLAYSYRIV
jgi:hypothetical protein